MIRPRKECLGIEGRVENFLLQGEGEEKATTEMEDLRCEQVVMKRWGKNF